LVRFSFGGKKKSSALELAGIGAIALVLVIAAFGLMLWSGFSISRLMEF